MIPESTQPSDHELIARVRAGDKSAFTRLYRRHEPALSRRLYRILGNQEDVKDMVQSTFMRILQLLDQYRPEHPFGPWLQSIGFRMATNQLRSRRRRARLKSRVKQVEEPKPGWQLSLVEDQAASREMTRLLYQAMEHLPAKKRIAYTLHELEGLGFSEIGRMVGASAQTIRARVLSARKIIRSRISRMDLAGKINPVTHRESR